MSIKISFYLVCIVLFFSCSSKIDKKEGKESAYFKDINVENIDFKHARFDTLDKSEGQEYVDFSYNFLQTSKFKRHLNQIGVLIDTTNYEYIKRLSYSYKKAGEHQKAVHLMELAIEKETNPDEKLAHIGYASWSYLYFYRDYKRAIERVDEMLEKSNQDNGIACHGEPCLLINGQALYRLHKYEEAIEAFTTYQNYQESQSFDKMDNSLVVFYKARCLEEVGRFKKAKEYYIHLVKDHPHAEAYFRLAVINKKTGNLLLSNQYLNKAEVALKQGYTFKEPYFERFDKVFEHNIEDFSN